ncbi:hypothetical protein [Alteromonas sp. a30]|uniref:hypothetical protein n=1 Tax=Alteromonas sp. a30 TaxID=2730917 RepID=UPI00227D9F38|nr:hypothetical protein [Alteromonas sp. a30]MCY7296911.1 hypothetical protein [Alteromonas sp. a30]
MKKEFKLLKSMWEKKERQLELIVPKVTTDGITGSLNNGHWAYQVGYAFRSALSISYDERVKLKKPYMVWTQGPNIHFKSGDFIISRCQTKAIQVIAGTGVERDKETNKMDLGSVTYDTFDKTLTGWKKTGTHNHNQMAFLALLISGQALSVEEVLKEELSPEEQGDQPLVDLPSADKGLTSPLPDNGKEEPIQTSLF